MLPGLSSRIPIKECQRQAGALLSICKGKKKKEEREIYLHFFYLFCLFCLSFRMEKEKKEERDSNKRRFLWVSIYKY